MFSVSVNPSIGKHLLYGNNFSIIGGNTISTVNLKASSSILGIYFAKILLEHSIQGLVFTSINHTPYFSSIIKSYPKISIHILRFLVLNLGRTDNKDYLTRYYILIYIFSLKLKSGSDLQIYSFH